MSDRTRLPAASVPLQNRISRQRLWTFITTPFMVTFQAFAIGAALSIWPSEISDAIKEFGRHPLRGDPALWVWVFVAVLTLWLVSMYHQLKEEQQGEEERIRAIRSWIDRAPNRLVFDTAVRGVYPAYWKQIEATRQSLKDVKLTHEERRTRLEEGLNALLGLVIDLAHAFNGRIAKERYGANLMIIISRGRAAPDFTPALLGALRFHPKDGAHALRGILYLPEAVLVRNSAAPARHLAGGFALPLIEPRETAAHTTPSLPGAPLCVDNQRANAYLDTLQLENDLVNLDPETASQIREYFARDGKHIRSFASYPITGLVQGENGVIATAVAGVLNLDSADPNLLGPDQESYTTFEALVAPLANRLFEGLTRYAELLVHTGHPAMVAGVGTNSRGALPAGGSGAIVDGG